MSEDIVVFLRPLGKKGRQPKGDCGCGYPAPISEPHSPLTQMLSPICGGASSSRPQTKEKVATMETQTTPPLLPHFPPAVTLPAATTGYFGLENKASDLFEQLFFHWSRSPGPCGHPGLGHFPRELTCFPFSTEDQFSNSDWPLLASPFPGPAAGGGPEVGHCVCVWVPSLWTSGEGLVPLLCQNLPLPSQTPQNHAHTNPPQPPTAVRLLHGETSK